jgi:hypothetical protein
MLNPSLYGTTYFGEDLVVSVQLTPNCQKKGLLPVNLSLQSLNTSIVAASNVFAWSHGFRALTIKRAFDQGSLLPYIDSFHRLRCGYPGNEGGIFYHR